MPSNVPTADITAGTIGKMKRRLRDTRTRVEKIEEDLPYKLLAIHAELHMAETILDVIRTRAELTGCTDELQVAAEALQSAAQQCSDMTAVRDRTQAGIGRLKLLLDMAVDRNLYPGAIKHRLPRRCEELSGDISWEATHVSEKAKDLLDELRTAYELALKWSATDTRAWDTAFEYVQKGEQKIEMVQRYHKLIRDYIREYDRIEQELPLRIDQVKALIRRITLYVDEHKDENAYQTKRVRDTISDFDKIVSYKLDGRKACYQHPLAALDDIFATLTEEYRKLLASSEKSDK